MKDLQNVNLLCMGCMQLRTDEHEVCPKCGYQADKANYSVHQLPPGTIISGRYLLGKVLGEGGFGITYIGYDLETDQRLAVKEYYPNGFATRNSTTTSVLQTYSGDKAKFFEQEKQRFIDEANRLVKFQNTSGIVSVYNCLIENATVYIVMEYVDGFTLKQYLAQMGGTLPTAQVFDMLQPLMESLIKIHKAGIIHRDISPDNIMITEQGLLKLIDFGAARNYSENDQKMSIRIKQGYSPEEQYRSKGTRGPWTDIYALCATIYRSITGIVPQGATERVVEDKVIPPSRLGIPIEQYQERALMRGMAVQQRMRFQNVYSLYNALYPRQEKVQVTSNQLVIILSVLLFTVIILLIIALAM